MTGVYHHGVHRPGFAGVVVGLVHGGKGSGFVRDGDVCSEKTGRRQSAQGGGEFGGTDVDFDIPGGDAGGLQSGVVKNRRLRMGDGIADDGEASRGREGSEELPAAENVGCAVNCPAHAAAASARWKRASTRSLPRISSIS